mmetsp:Transcript_52719/g.120299  ORF Transcript_52719/g.120299 Transcript_52719/m.120299 type:complete len:306 (+) Transcript_52719:1626-2543(+)
MLMVPEGQGLAFNHGAQLSLLHKIQPLVLVLASGYDDVTLIESEGLASVAQRLDHFEGHLCKGLRTRQMSLQQVLRQHRLQIRPKDPVDVFGQNLEATAVSEALHAGCPLLRRSQKGALSEKITSLSVPPHSNIIRQHHGLPRAQQIDAVAHITLPKQNLPVGVLRVHRCLSEHVLLHASKHFEAGDILYVLTGLSHLVSHHASHMIAEHHRIQGVDHCLLRSPDCMRPRYSPQQRLIPNHTGALVYNHHFLSLTQHLQAAFMYNIHGHGNVVALAKKLPFLQLKHLHALQNLQNLVVLHPDTKN